MRDPTAIDPVLLSAVRQLADEARRAAALVKADSPEHDFYVGVQYAAEHRIRPGLAGADPDDISHRSPAFRDGYLEASTLIGLAGTGIPPLHLPLPVFTAP